MHRLLLGLLLALPAHAGELGFKEVFDPYHPAFPATGDRFRMKCAAFDRAVEKSGVARLVKHLKRMDSGLEAIDKELSREYEVYLKSHARYWGWRAKYARDYERKHGRPAAQFDVPPAINDDFIEKEKALKKAQSFKRRERSFHAYVMKRAAERISKQEPGKRAKTIAVLGAGLKDRLPRQRLRCVLLLREIDDDAARSALTRAVEKEKNPVVAAEMLPPLSMEVLRTAIAHADWRVRAGAVHALADRRTRESVALLIEHLGKQKGILLDDFTEVLQVLTARGTGCDAAAWTEWWSEVAADWKPPRVAAAAQEEDRENPPSVFSDGPTRFLGIPTSSRAVVYCVEGSPASWEFIEKELKSSIDALPEDASFQIVICSDGAKRFRKKLVPADPAHKKSAADFLARFKPNGRVDLVTGVFEALRTPFADTVYLFTTRGSTWGWYTDSPQVAQEITALNRIRGYRIHAFGFSSGRDAYYLQEIARQFGGTFKPPR